MKYKKTILCPNCSEPFIEDCGKLNCPTHGWHEFNQAGEVIPADEPTLEEIKQYEHMTKVGEALADGIAGLAEEQRQKEDRDYGLHYDTQVWLVMAAVCGVAAIIVIASTVYKQQQRKKVISNVQ